jgi:hypothetical protein
MFSDVKLHVMYRIANATIREWPFAHIYVENVFPADFFAELQANLPANDGYKVLQDTGRVGKGYSRARLALFPSDLDDNNLSPIQQKFWGSVFATLGDPEFGNIILSLFRRHIEQRFVAEQRSAANLSIFHETFLMRDLNTYSLGPHTDNPTKLVSMLFYLAQDASKPYLGTSLYLPKERKATCPGGPHHPFDLFDRVQTLPYASNVVAAFPKTAACFHGVEPVIGEDNWRDVLFFDLKMRG